MTLPSLNVDRDQSTSRVTNCDRLSADCAPNCPLGRTLEFRNLYLDPPLPMIESPRMSPHCRLVEGLSQSESEIFFALVGYQVDQTGVGSHSNDGLANMIYEAATIGIAQWLVECRPDVLAELLSPWIVVCN